MAESIEEKLGEAIEHFIDVGKPFAVVIDAEGGELNNFWTVEPGPPVENNSADSTTGRLLGCALFLGIAGIFEGVKLVKEYKKCTKQ
jgi:hypothetical protein